MQGPTEQRALQVGNIRIEVQGRRHVRRMLLITNTARQQGVRMRPAERDAGL